MREELVDHDGVSASEDGLLQTSDLQMALTDALVHVDRLDTTTTRYKREIGPHKMKMMTNNPNSFQR